MLNPNQLVDGFNLLLERLDKIVAALERIADASEQIEENDASKE